MLLHGYLEAGEVWEPLAERLAYRFRVIMPDLPGHGSSGISGDTHTMEFLAGATRAVISDAVMVPAGEAGAIGEERSPLSEGVENSVETNAGSVDSTGRPSAAAAGGQKRPGTGRVLMVGHSLGGYVTLAFAELYPELLAGYVLFHSHPHADTPEAIAKRNREIAVVSAGKKNIMYPGNVSMMFARHNLGSMTAELERSKRIASRNPGEGIIAMLNGMIVRPSRRDIVESGKIPLLWILGRHDLYFTPERALRDIMLPANARVEILEESGHLGFIEETERSAQLLEEFAAGIEW